MNFEVVAAHKKHAADLGFIHSKSWQKAYAGIIPDYIIADFTPDNRAKVFEQAITARPEEYYMFTVDGSPSGLAILSKSSEEDQPDYIGEIYAIYFHPDYWGTQATVKAFEFCINRLKELGFTQIHIWVLEDNLRARKFYEKFGFVFDGSTKEIVIGKPLKEIRYTIRLSS